ncbi:MAG: hypothetical protein AAF961_04005, partial [Planctomycetota bacterium]
SHWETDVPVGALHFPHRNALLIADWAGNLVCWSPATQRPIASFAPLKKDAASAASFSPDANDLKDLWPWTFL